MGGFASGLYTETQVPRAPCQDLPGAELDSCIVPNAPEGATLRSLGQEDFIYRDAGRRQSGSSPPAAHRNHPGSFKIFPCLGHTPDPGNQTFGVEGEESDQMSGFRNAFQVILSNVHPTKDENYEGRPEVL